MYRINVVEADHLGNSGQQSVNIGNLALFELCMIHMMTSSNGNIFRVTGHLCGEFTGPRWIPHTKASDAELLMFSLICTRINGWVNNGEAGDLRRHRAHYDVTVMSYSIQYLLLS